jgi:hypothetical protein
MSSFTPLSPQDEQTEQARVAKLTPFEKEMELRDLNRKIATLEMLRNINTGELYTWRGKFKQLTKDYGVPLLVWYWTVWCGTLACTYGAMELGGLDAISLLAQVDAYTGWTLAQHVSKEVGTIGLALAVNELLEPIRLPLVIVTTKPVVNFFYPPKY